MNNDEIVQAQKEMCAQYGASFVESPPAMKVGIAKNVRSGLLPINGLRHQPEGDTTGWYIWAGDDLPDDSDFFVPLHVDHLREWSPVVLPYLGLAPGWRFLVAGAYEDVWEDPSLLAHEGS